LLTAHFLPLVIKIASIHFIFISPIPPTHTPAEFREHTLKHRKDGWESFFDDLIAVVLTDEAAILKPSCATLAPIEPNRFCVSGGTISQRESAITRLLGVDLRLPGVPKSKPRPRSQPREPEGKPLKSKPSLPPPPPPATVISDPHMRAILLMDEAISRNTPPEELITNPRAGLHLRDGPPVTGPCVGQGSVRLSVPAPIVSFFVERFAVAPPQGMAHRFRKVFPNSQKPMSLRLPIQLPITCTANGKSIALGFVDTARISAVDTKNHISQILNNLCSIPLLLANFRKVDPRFVVPRLLAFANDAKLVAMYDIEHQDQEQDTADVTV
jgi:hypothetical protein